MILQSELDEIVIRSENEATESFESYWKSDIDPYIKPLRFNPEFEKLLRQVIMETYRAAAHIGAGIAVSSTLEFLLKKARNGK